MEKEKVFSRIRKMLEGNGFQVNQEDMARPWGGFFVIEEDQTKEFIKTFFAEVPYHEIGAGKISPKILLVEPGKKLSWQYHYRRSERWKVLEGDPLIIRSDTDEEKLSIPLNEGDGIMLRCGERHRLIGGQHWAIIAEIWIHDDPDNPSDEEDIVRLNDDFGR